MAFGGFGGRKHVNKFSPRQVAALTGWLRLDSSTPVSGEWPSVTDVLNPGSPMTQTAAVRKAAVGITSNGLRSMIYDGSDMYLWPQSPSQSSTTKIGIWLWFKPATVTSGQWLYSVIGTISGAPFHRFRFGTNASQFLVQIWMGGGSNVRHFSTADNFFTVGVWTAVYFQYDSSRGGDANVAIYKNGVLAPATGIGDDGGVIGPTGLGVLQGAASGNAVIGSFNDADSPAQPILAGGEMGPNIFAFNDNLTADQIAAFYAYESPEPIFGGVRINSVISYPRLALSTPVASEWETILDAVGGVPMLQPSANRKAAIGTAMNCQTMILDGSDMYTVALTPVTYSTTKFGYLFWIKPGSISGTQTFLFAPTSGAVLQFHIIGAGLQFNIVMDAGATKGRIASVSNILTTGIWHHIYWQYDSSRGGDPNELLFINGIAVALTYANYGIGQALGVLQPLVSGSVTWFAGSNNDAPSAALANGSEVTPVIVVNENLTAAQLAAIMAFEAPVPVINGLAIPISSFLRLALSTAVAGEWPTVVDAMNPANPMVQPSVNRKAAVGSAINCQTMVYDASDVHMWPLVPGHSSTTKVGIFVWFKPSTIAATQVLYYTTTAGLTRLSLFANGTEMRCEAYITNANGRLFLASNVLTVGAWHAIYMQYDSSRGGDANMALFVNGISKTFAIFNIGAGGTLGALQTASGSASVGGTADSDSPGSPIANGGEITAPIAFSDNLTAAQLAAIMTYEAPVPVIGGIAQIAITAWYRLSQAIVTGSGVSSIPDRLNSSNPATQTVDAKRPALSLSGNSLPILVGVSSALAIPLIPAINGPNILGIAFWAKMSTVNSCRPWGVRSGGASADRFHMTIGADGSLGIFAYPANVLRQGVTAGGLIVANTWTFITIEMDLLAATEAPRLIITTDQISRAVTLSGAGTLGALPTPTGTMSLMAMDQTPNFPAIMQWGPNIYLLGNKMPTATVGLLTTAAREALANLEKPT